MSWNEFCTLLAGIMPKTPLGEVINIRSEEDKDVLKYFTEGQHRIRNEWRNRQVETMSDEEKKETLKELQNIFSMAFS